jgi:AcrR family transcriptional regulator
VSAHSVAGPSDGVTPPGRSATRVAPARATRLSRPARRRQLLGAARQVFVAQGYHAAAMDEIAERAGVSKPVLYQHFPGKLELYLALLDESAGELVERVRQALNSTTDNALRVRRTMEAYFNFVDDDNGAYQLVFESDLRSEPAVRNRVEGSLSECVEAIATTIAADTGVPRSEAELLSVGLAGLAEVGARWWLGSRGMPGSTATPGPARSLTKERAIELMIDLAWRGLSGSPRHGDSSIRPFTATDETTSAAEPPVG